MRQKLLLIVSCFAVLCFMSCRESDNGDNKTVTNKESEKSPTGDSTRIVENTRDDESAPTDTLTEEVPEIVGSLSQLNRRLNKKASHFVIRNNRDTVIKCKEGTLLSIPANAFINAATQKPVEGTVKISVKEYYKTSDMIMAGLTTASNNRLLETGGMINIKVVSKENNDSCILKPGKNIAIAMPSATEDVDRMQLFNGVHDSSGVNWQAQGGMTGMAQRWSRRRDFNTVGFNLGGLLVFPDQIVKVKPALINSKPENFQTEINVSLRDLIQQTGVATKKANGYIDTSGNLHCYRIAGNRQKISFPGLYSPTSLENTKVNLAVDVTLSFKCNLNQGYYQKLFQMGKGNPDSLIVVTVTLNPAIKLTGTGKIETEYENFVGLKDYRRLQKQQVLIEQEYQKKIKQLRLDAEQKMTDAQNNSAASLKSAQDYLLLSTPKLGWINCDRFYSSPAKTDYLVKMNDCASLLIVFNSLKSIIASDSRGVFGSVPLNEKITIVGLKTENGKLMMACHETTITKEPFDKLTFRPVTVKEYKSRLERLNGM